MRFYPMKAVVFFAVLCASVAHPMPLAQQEKKDSGSEQLSEPQSKESETKNKKTAGDIFQFDNPEHLDVLNKPTRPVKKLPDPEVDKLINLMLSKMRVYGGGVGISANQVGHSLQVSIVKDPFDLKNPGNYKVYINPVITKASEQLHCFWHGCLSLNNGRFGKVATWREITVSALDQLGKPFTENLSGTNAVIFQHEFRHLLGGGYMDYASASRSEAEMLQAMLKEMKEKTFSYLEICKDGEKALLNDYLVGETIDSYSERIFNKPAGKKSHKAHDSANRDETVKPENKK